MDQHSSILSPCARPVMAVIASDETAIPRTEDALLFPNGGDPWYSLGFGLSNMFFSLAPSENYRSR